MSSVAQWSVSSRRAGIIHTTNSYNSPIYIPGTVLSPADALGLTELPVHSRDGNKQYWYYLIWWLGGVQEDIWKTWRTVPWECLKEEHSGRGNGKCKGLEAGTYLACSKNSRETNVADTEWPGSRVVEDEIIKVAGGRCCYSEPEGKVFLSGIGSMIWWIFQGFPWLPCELTAMSGGRGLFLIAQSR